MSYRQPQYTQYRSWNASALGLKTEESVTDNKIDDVWSKDRQRPRRESWSQPSQRGRRGRGRWYIDNRPPPPRRRYTMPNSSDCQDYNYCTNNDEWSDYNQYEENHNPILEEPSRNITNSPEGETKEDDSGKWDNKDQDEPPRKPHSDNNYRPPKSRSTSYIKEHWKTNSSIDDGSPSQSYSNSHSNGSKKHELNNYESYKVQWNNNTWEKESTNYEPDQAWVHDKYESLETETNSDSKDKKDASKQVSPIDLNNESLKLNNTNEVTEFSKKIDEPDSPKDQTKKPLIINSELPKEITIKFSELTLKESVEEPSETIISQTPVQENKELLLIDPGVTETTSEVAPEVAPKVAPEVTPVAQELPMLINLDEEANNAQPIQPRISQDILVLDWEGYQKGLIEEELRITMERQATQTYNPHKLDTGLKDFDSLL